MPASAFGAAGEFSGADDVPGADEECMLRGAPAEKPSKWTARPSAPIRNDLGFFLLGVINNSSYVIMMAFAKDILPSAVGVVFLSLAGPALIVTVSAPYWFHHVSYRVRVIAASVLMMLSFTTVSQGLETRIQLAGVVFSSLQGSLGETSCLALASLYNTPRALTAWSSGTGFAGIFGYAWVFFFRFVLEKSLRSTLQMAHLLAVAWLLTYFVLLGDPHTSDTSGFSGAGVGTATAHGGFSRGDDSPSKSTSTSLLSRGGQVMSDGRQGVRDRVGGRVGWDGIGQCGAGVEKTPMSTAADQPLLHVQQRRSEGKLHALNSITTRGRLRFTLGLWRFMVPLGVVFFAEYTMQTGTWSAVGFPVTSPEARKRFYEYSNWSYQAGVFVARSSGMILPLSVGALWTLPAVQLSMLLFFYLVAVEHFWYNDTLLLMCFGVGLVGGLAYVNGFRLMAEAVRPELKELALGSGSVAGSFGVMTSDIAGVALQKYLYKRNGISD